MTPYYEDDYCTIFCDDAVKLLFADDDTFADTVVVTDPPYGLAYHSNRPRREGFARKITGDKTTALRDFLVLWLEDDQPALIFGSPRIAKPAGTKGTLVWDKGGALGMGDLSLPWKFDHEEIYVLGTGFVGRRDCGSVLRFPPVQTSGRHHPNEKPVGLMTALIAKCPPRLTVLDPYMGSGSTLVAAKRLGRRAIGIERDEAYCAIAVKRLGQEVLDLGA